MDFLFSVLHTTLLTAAWIRLSCSDTLTSLWILRCCLSQCEWHKSHFEIHFLVARGSGLRCICKNDLNLIGNHLQIWFAEIALHAVFCFLDFLKSICIQSGYAKKKMDKGCQCEQGLSAKSPVLRWAKLSPLCCVPLIPTEGGHCHTGSHLALSQKALSPNLMVCRWDSITHTTTGRYLCGENSIGNGRKWGRKFEGAGGEIQKKREQKGVGSRWHMQI